MTLLDQPAPDILAAVTHSDQPASVHVTPLDLHAHRLLMQAGAKGVLRRRSMRLATLGRIQAPEPGSHAGASVNALKRLKAQAVPIAHPEHAGQAGGWPIRPKVLRPGIRLPEDPGQGQRTNAGKARLWLSHGPATRPAHHPASALAAQTPSAAQTTTTSTPPHHQRGGRAWPAST